MGNHLQTVSCRYESHGSHAGQETFREQFPIAMKHIGFMPDRKPFANSFLPL
jgi:hypothetical protein